MILYNGATGGIGRYLLERIDEHGLRSHALEARLESQQALDEELGSLALEHEATFIHLAGMVSVPACEADPGRAYKVNVTFTRSTINTVINWASRSAVRLRIIYVSSGHVYAAPPHGTRVAEDAPASPRSVYGTTKHQAEQELSAIATKAGVPLLIARLFGLVGPQQAPNYVLPGLIERIRTGRVENIPGLEHVRDYLDARDVCEDVLLLASATWAANPVVVNVCSGTPVTIKQLLREAADALKPGEADALIKRATAGPARTDDVPWLVGDPGRFCQLTGAFPQRISLAQTARDAVATSPR